MIQVLLCISDEPSPRKRSKAVVRNFDAPLVPTHSRSTRFKEIKEKEAKLLKLREKRSKSRRSKQQTNNAKVVDPAVKDVVKKIVDTVDDKETKRSARVLKQDKRKDKRTSSRQKWVTHPACSLPYPSPGHPERP